jgi:hypothetical protein
VTFSISPWMFSKETLKTWTIPNIELLLHVSYVNLQGKSNNFHWNHSTQKDVHDAIFNEEVFEKNMNIIHIFTLASLSNVKSGWRGFIYVFHDVEHIMGLNSKTTFFWNRF